MGSAEFYRNPADRAETSVHGASLDSSKSPPERAPARRSRTAVFVPLQEPGHIIPTFKLAERLQSDGFRVIYVVKSQFLKWIAERGFETFTWPSQDAIRCSPETSKWILDTKMLVDATSELFDQTEPSILFLDVHVSCFFGVLGRRSLPAILLCTGYDTETYVRASLAPITRCYGAAEWRMASPLAVYDWWMRVRLFPRLNMNAGNRFLWRWRIWLRSCGLTLKRTSMAVPVLDLPEFVLGTPQFSLRRFPSDRYFGFCLPSADNNPLPNNLEQQIGDRRLIYLSFGTQSRRYARAKSVLEVVVNAMEQMPNYTLVVSGGKTIINSYRIRPQRNVFLFESVNQVKLLERVQIAIIHGGHGSIKECIAHRVRMIVVPFAHDQFANAVRVERLGLGLRLRANEVTKEKIVACVRRLETDRTMTTRLELGYDKESDERQFEAAYRNLLCLV